MRWPRTQRLRRHALGLVLAASFFAGPAVAADPAVVGGGVTHPFALGWDSGIGARYRFGGCWGLGLRVNPDLSDRESQGVRSNEERDESRSETSIDDFDDEDLGVGLMLYRETRIGRWLGFGPYAELAYSRSTYTDITDRIESNPVYSDAETRVYESNYSSDSTLWSVSVGVRPTFTFRDRFALESRLGVTLGVRESDYRRSYVRETLESGVVVDTSHNTYGTDSSEWNVSVFGQELGPGATLTFMAYF